ncbi:hypothetical protein cand_032160 [Cryptosporidium andersoni]|uniref:pyridoxal kinase n=1 Tax=Cryptosporidium andersoni TaxID=117008 RepID=A0A1J4MBZ0_9CRYT|nr:hypothetical protein cand_032160 [Cryptosporidium andersoni]
MKTLLQGVYELVYKPLQKYIDNKMNLLDISVSLRPYDIILSGYIADPLTLNEIHKFVTNIKDNRITRNPFWICDPVLGDHGTFYVSKELVEVYLEILHTVDILTPNQFEFIQLARKLKKNANILPYLKTNMGVTGEQKLSELNQLEIFNRETYENIYGGISLTQSIEYCKLLLETGLKNIIVTSLNLIDDFDHLFTLLATYNSNAIATCFPNVKLDLENCKVNVVTIRYKQIVHSKIFYGMGDLFAALFTSFLPEYDGDLCFPILKAIYITHYIIKYNINISREVTTESESSSVRPLYLSSKLLQKALLEINQMNGDTLLSLYDIKIHRIE